jgi:hypothetical protein
MSDMFPEPEPRREVTLGGKFLGLGIFGGAVIWSIMMEKFGDEAARAQLPFILLGALAAAVVVPWLLCRRTVRY